MNLPDPSTPARLNSFDVRGVLQKFEQLQQDALACGLRANEYCQISESNVRMFDGAKVFHFEARLPRGSFIVLVYMSNSIDPAHRTSGLELVSISVLP